MPVRTLELLAPARNLEIGIAAIDCGADAVYIAGPAFGARQAAGNSVADIRTLTEYAHRFGARIYVTVNTIIYDTEWAEAEALVRSLADAGVDALIVQDLALIGLCRSLDLPVHASTQCAIRTPERARFLESLGFTRLVPERQLSLAEVRAIRDTVRCELECFVHGALCVCYSGQCYLSEFIDRRSANRGACIQACRSRYDLVDASGKVLVRNKALLSLRDFQLLERLEDLAEAGACSFKIEGRLKSISYVRNVVRAYSLALDELVAHAPGRYARASFGRVVEGFTPDLRKTFQRGYTELYLDGQRARDWSSAEAPKSIGEEVGTIVSAHQIRRDSMELSVEVPAGISLENGDGFAVIGRGGEIIGFRGDTCHPSIVAAMGNLSSTLWIVRGKWVDGINCGPLYRNLSMAFEREMDRRPCRRMVSVALSLDVRPDTLHVTARSEDGRVAEADFSTAGFPVADNLTRMREIISGQLSKTSDIYSFSLTALPKGPLPLLRAAFLNDIRREMASALDRLNAGRPGRVPFGKEDPSVRVPETLTYRENVANALSRAVYEARGARQIDPAYELSHTPGAELMRSRYCIRYELGLCPKHQGARETGPLFLLNNGRRLSLHFHCTSCEMTVHEA